MSDPAATPTSVVVCINDLIFETKIRSTAQTMGLSVRTVRTPSQMATELAQGEPQTVIIDLNTAGGDASGAIRAAKAAPQPPRVIAFFSHVDAELARAAKDASADEVMPRSRFHNELRRLLSGQLPSA